MLVISHLWKLLCHLVCSAWEWEASLCSSSVRLCAREWWRARVPRRRYYQSHQPSRRELVWRLCSWESWLFSCQLCWSGCPALRHLWRIGKSLMVYLEDTFCIIPFSVYRLGYKLATVNYGRKRSVVIYLQRNICFSLCRTYTAGFSLGIPSSFLLVCVKYYFGQC